MFKTFLRNEAGSTLQIVGTTAGALAVCFMFAAAVLDKATQPGSGRPEAGSFRERLAALPRAMGVGAPRGLGLDYGTTATIPGIRNVILDPCSGMPK